MEKNNFILGLDVSSKTIGISLFEDLGTKGELKLLHHVTPKVKSKNKLHELFEKVNVFENEFLNKYTDIGINRVIIEEPLLQSNNVYTVGTLLRFNGMIAKAVYDKLGIVPDFISSYDSRKYAFPELMAIRTHDKMGTPYNERELKKKKPVLFGAYPYDTDKKMVVFEKVYDLEPQIIWLYNKKNILKKENFDMADAFAAVHGFMRKNKIWK